MGYGIFADKTFDAINRVSNQYKGTPLTRPSQISLAVIIDTHAAEELREHFVSNSDCAKASEVFVI